MTKQNAIKQLETIIGKISHLQYHIQGGTDLQEAVKKIAYARDKLSSNQNEKALTEC